MSLRNARCNDKEGDFVFCANKYRALLHLEHICSFLLYVGVSESVRKDLFLFRCVGHNDKCAYRNWWSGRLSGLRIRAILWKYTGLFEMIVGDLIVIYNTLAIGAYVFFYLIEQHFQVFVTYLIGALYAHPL